MVVVMDLLPVHTERTPDEGQLVVMTYPRTHAMSLVEQFRTPRLCCYNAFTNRVTLDEELERISAFFITIAIVLGFVIVCAIVYLCCSYCVMMVEDNGEGEYDYELGIHVLPRLSGP